MYVSADHWRAVRLLVLLFFRKQLMSFFALNFWVL